ncbi:RNA polymerase sigma factor [Spirosoma koreense]
MDQDDFQPSSSPKNPINDAGESTNTPEGQFGNGQLTEEQRQWDQLRQQQANSLAWFYQQYGRMLHNYGYRLVEDRELVKDTVQDLFVQLWQNAPKLPAISSAKAYLLVAMRREILRRITQQRQFTELTNDEDEADPSIEVQIIEKQRDEQISENLMHVVNQLPARQREIIFLKYYSALSTEEIATVMQLTTPSVYKLIYKALDRLKQLCSGWGEAIWAFIILTFAGLFR